MAFSNGALRRALSYEAAGFTIGTDFELDENESTTV
jgi:hypothetical protein